MRMFVALVPPDDVVEDLDEFLDPRREHASFRWTAPEQVHLTLAFLPAIPDRALDDLTERLAIAASRRASFAAQIAGGGAFPDPSRAKVLWAGLRADAASLAELERLAVGARHAADASGVEVDGGRFRPHLTVARLGRPEEVTRWIRVLDSYSGPAWSVDRISLIASHLGEGPRRRPRYEVVEEFALG